MVICQYPNCRSKALWTPVVELPTIRTLGDSSVMIRTERPTVLLGREVCQAHRDSYNLTDWVSAADWALLDEAARANGFELPSAVLTVVQFRPVGWTPTRHFELER